MKLRRREISLLAVLAALLVFWHFNDKREPSYQGRKFSTWVSEISGAYVPEEQKAAFRAMAPESVPLVREMLAGRQPLMHQFWHKLPPRQLPKSVSNDLKKASEEQQIQQWLALRVVVAMGDTAAPLAPDLIKYRSRYYQAEVAEALASIGPPAYPFLIERLAGPDSDEKVNAIRAVGLLRPLPVAMKVQLIRQVEGGEMPTSGLALQTLRDAGVPTSELIPSLYQGLEHTNTTVRANIIGTFTQIIRHDPKALAACLPVATSLLQDPDRSVRVRAAMVLGEFGASSTPSLPALKLLTSDPDPLVQSVATIQIRRIDPKALAVDP